MSDLARRVAVRFSTSAQAAVGKTAGFIPDKFWRAKKAELKAILKKPLKRKEIYEVRQGLREVVLPFFEDFIKELKGFGLHRDAIASVDNRFDTVKHVLEKFIDGYEKFEQQLDSAAPYPISTLDDDMAFTVMVRMRSHWEDSTDDLSDALKAIWKTDARLIQGLSKRLLKKMPPEVRDAAERSRNGDWGVANETKWRWLNEQNLDGLAKRLITKEKVTYDFLHWFDNMQKVLSAVYSEQGLMSGDRYTEFDLYGMKVVIDDATVTEPQTKTYIKYLDEAYHLLKAKKLSKAWYGKVFIQCEDCGGENQHGKNLGVGGHYEIGPDTVSIFVRPSKFVVELMVHELGHRYWYKQMTSEQRVRFRMLVKVKDLAPAERMFSNESLSWAKQDFRKWFEDLRDHLIRYEKIESFSSFPDQAMEWIRGIQDRGSKVGGVIDRALIIRSKEAPRGVKKYHDAVMTAGSELSRALQTTAILNDTAAPFLRDPKNPETIAKHKTAREKFCDQALEALLKVQDVFDTYIEMAPQVWQLERQRQFDEDERPVTPVSTYGESNIDEAFAEVFAHYVLEYDITRDQLESFRSVLSSTITAGDDHDFDDDDET